MADTSVLRCLDEPTAVGLREEQPDGAVLAGLAAQAAALGDPTRAAIAHALRAGEEVCVCDLSWILGRPLKVISHHVGKMRTAGVVASRQEGRLVMCRLTDDGGRLLDALSPAPAHAGAGSARD
jgi:DNA-binding transcriptional ArsR family regulator